MPKSWAFPFHTPKGDAILSSTVKIEEKKKAVDQGIDPTVQIKVLIKVLKTKIVHGKKNLLRRELSLRLISMDTRRGRTRIRLKHLWIYDHRKQWISTHIKVMRSDLIFIFKLQIIYMYFFLRLGRIRFDLLHMELKDLIHFIFCSDFSNIFKSTHAAYLIF